MININNMLVEEGEETTLRS